jgi:tripartite-type tricarboxylate transporter receptor subunit TctC
VIRTLIASAVSALLLATSASAQPAAGGGKTLEINVGTSAGAGYDLYARLLARHLGKHIAGAPALVVKNMAGAGGMRLFSYLANVAPKDGSVIGTFGRGVAFEDLLNPKSGMPDGRTFGWLGSMNDEVSVCVAWKSSDVTKFEDVMTRELTVGASGAGGDTFIFPSVLNGVLGTRFKIVNGYPGGNEISMALERGEVQGRCGWSWSSLKATHLKWVETGQMRVITQIGLTKHPDLPNVPLALEFAKTAEQSDALRLVFARQSMAWPFAAPPGTPKARVEELRKAFAATLDDPEFVADAQKIGLEVRQVHGEEIDTILAQAYGVAEGTVRRTAEMLKAGK